MSDPKRWREGEGELASFVGALAKREPSSDVRERVWGKITPMLPPGSGSSSGGSSSSSGAAGATTKAFVALGTIVSLGAIGFFALREPPSSTPVSDASPAISAALEPKPTPIEPPVEPADPPMREPVARPPTKIHAAPTVAPSATAAPSAAATTDRLREEAEGVRKARMMLREKNATAALLELERLDKLVPNGPLAEEREVLTIEALSAAGKTDAARRRADRFLFERPRSPHASRVRSFTSR